MGAWQQVRLNSGLAGDADWRRCVARWSVVSLLLIALAAHNSYGFYQFDEHYQVMEFVGYKLGKTPASELAWEYRAQIRPWLQPGLYYVAAKALAAVGVQNPFSLAFAFRAISGLIGWSAIVALMLSANVLVGAGLARRLAVVLLATLWLIPYLVVRTSGESLSGSFFALGIAALLLGSSAATVDSVDSGGSSWIRSFDRRRFFPLAQLLAGICFGLAFEFRFQIAFGVIGVTAWMLLASTGGIWRRFGGVALVGCGVVAMVALGTLVDRWGYGHWTIVPWNYFHKDILEGRPSFDGTAPVWGYLSRVLLNPMMPITALWLAAMLIAWFRHPRHIVVWATLPFVVAHSLVPHKELRYLFPIALVATFAFALALVPSGARPAPAWLQKIWALRQSAWAKLLVACNIVGLLYVCSQAHEPSVTFQRDLYDHYPNGATMYVLGAKTRSPFENVGATMFFYRPPNFVCKRLNDEGELAAILRTDPGDCLVVQDRLAAWSPPQSSPADARLVYSTYPAWVERFNIGNWLRNSKRFSMYEVHPRSAAVVAANEANEKR